MGSLRDLQKSWEGLAQADPLWAICTDPARRNGKWSKNEFFASGKDEIATVMECVRSLHLQVDRDLAALDFGCGVGRLTRAMAAHFPECWGVDISPTMVRLAAEFNRDVPQCRFVLNERGDLGGFQDAQFGFVYSSIVLQHIPPRYGKQYLAELVRVLKPGGILVFQLLDDFRAGVVARWRQRLGLRRTMRKLTSRSNGNHLIDLHCIREHEVRLVLQSVGAKLVDVRLTNSADPAFNGKLCYLQTEPAQGFISKQYCVIKNRIPYREEQAVGE